VESSYEKIPLFGQHQAPKLFAAQPPKQFPTMELLNPDYGFHKKKRRSRLSKKE